MTRRAWACGRLAAAAAVLVVVVVHLGSGPFAAGLRSVSGWPVAAAVGIGGATTASCAWRWCLVARGLGVPLAFGSAVAAYYRSQFLNGTLPGGMVGDIHRGVRHGRDTGDLGRGLRAVAWERAAGQTVQVLASCLVLTLARSPVRAAMPIVLLAAASCTAAAVWVVVRVAPRTGTSRWTRVAGTIGTELRDGVGARDRWRGVVGMSLLSLAGHAATFLIAARVVGVTAPIGRLFPLALLVLLVAAVPVNIGGWGPREGAAAWAFAAAGLGAGHGVATGTAYGVLAAAASLPGAVVLVAGWLRRRPAPNRKTSKSVPAVPRRDLAGVGRRGDVDG